jgi:hypothetical protein
MEMLKLRLIDDRRHMLISEKAYNNLDKIIKAFEKETLKTFTGVRKPRTILSYKYGLSFEGNKTIPLKELFLNQDRLLLDLYLLEEFKNARYAIERQIPFGEFCTEKHEVEIVDGFDFNLLQNILKSDFDAKERDYMQLLSEKPTSQLAFCVRILTNIEDTTPIELLIKEYCAIMEKDDIEDVYNQMHMVHIRLTSFGYFLRNI